MRKESWAFCAPLTKIVTSQVGLLLIQYLNQMSFRLYCSESSETWYTYETRWEELQNIKYFVAMASFSVWAFINYLIFYSPVGPQWEFSCFWYALALLDQLLTAIGCNCLPVRLLKEHFKNYRKGVWNLTCCYGNKKFMFSSSNYMRFKYWINANPNCDVTISVKGAQNVQFSFAFCLKIFETLKVHMSGTETAINKW